jgi:hypothetical protein
MGDLLAKISLGSGRGEFIWKKKSINLKKEGGAHIFAQALFLGIVGYMTRKSNKNSGLPKFAPLWHSLRSDQYCHNPFNNPKQHKIILLGGIIIG